MKTIRLSRDLLCGALLILVAGFFLIASQKYALGTPNRMGPAFFPVLLAVLLGLVGVALCVRGAASGDKDLVVAELALRPTLLIMASIGVFGLLLRPGGLVLALAASLLIAVFARPGARWTEALAIVAVLVAFGVLLFHYLLRITVGLWPAFLY